MTLDDVLAPQGAPGSALCVLVVDDETGIAEEMAIGLELAGYPAIAVSSAREALALLAQRPDIGVLLSDIRMPQEDGIGLSRKALAGRGDRDAIGVILMTGHGIEATPEGVKACIPKPFAMDTMVGLVARTLDEVAARRAASKSGE
jgi:DNA-binding NtrC family response regulator